MPARTLPVACRRSVRIERTHELFIQAELPVEAFLPGEAKRRQTSRCYAEAGREMAGWIKSGKLQTREDIVSGLETFPETLLKLFNGENFGKLVLRP